MTDDRELELARIARILKEKGMTPAELLTLLERLADRQVDEGEGRQQV